MARPSRRERILVEEGGGHAGHLVRLVARHGGLDPALVDLLAELVGRLAEAEEAHGRLEAEVVQLRRQLADQAAQVRS